MSLLPYLHRVAAREDLGPDQAQAAMDVIFEGQASTPQVAAFLVALKMKGETPDELFGFARAMRARVHRVDCGHTSLPLIDTCGTGGVTASTFNISTIAAFVVAGAGVRVAKHGNRSLNSSCGSADLLESLGVNLQMDSASVGACVREVGIGFLFAPALHPAMKHAQPARAELKMRTVFNLLGPLTNPAGADAQLIGAPSRQAAELMAGALSKLGTRHSFVVHGFDGLDEVSTTGPTMVFEVRGSSVEKQVWRPADFGVPTVNLEELAGGTREHNTATARSVLAGDHGATREIVLVNSAVALLAAGRVASLLEGMEVAAASIDSGSARRRLELLVNFSRDQLHAGTNRAS